MRGLFTKQEWLILAGQTVSGVAVHAQTVRIERGRVWITVEGVPHDYWLAAGSSFAAPPGRLVVIEAVREDSLVAVATAGTRSILAPLRRLARRLVPGEPVLAEARKPLHHLRAPGESECARTFPGVLPLPGAHQVRPSLNRMEKPA